MSEWGLVCCGWRMQITWIVLRKHLVLSKATHDKLMSTFLVLWCRVLENCACRVLSLAKASTFRQPLISSDSRCFFVCTFRTRPPNPATLSPYSPKSDIRSLSGKLVSKDGNFKSPAVRGTRTIYISKGTASSTSEKAACNPNGESSPAWEHGSLIFWERSL